MLYCRFYGDKNSPITLVFLHGFLGSSLDFEDLIEKLQDKYYCIAIDLPSHGKSAKEPNTLEALERTLEKIPSFIFIGYSMGGRIALAFAKKHPLKVKMNLLLSAHFGLSCPLQKKEREKENLVWSKRLKTLALPQFLELWYAQKIFQSLQKKPEILNSMIEKRTLQDRDGLSFILQEQCLSKQPLYTSFLQPTYFFFGEEDEKYKNLYTALSHSMQIEIEGAGHTVHLEQPDSLAKTIEHLIQKEIHL